MTEKSNNSFRSRLSAHYRSNRWWWATITMMAAIVSGAYFWPAPASVSAPTVDVGESWWYPWTYGRTATAQAAANQAAVISNFAMQRSFETSKVLVMSTAGALGLVALGGVLINYKRLRRACIDANSKLEEAVAEVREDVKLLTSNQHGLVKRAELLDERLGALNTKISEMSEVMDKGFKSVASEVAALKKESQTPRKQSPSTPASVT